MGKTLFFVILTLFIILTPVYSLQSFNGSLIDHNDLIGFTVAPSFGYLYGESREIVYLSSIDKTYLSELIWDLSDILYIGGSASLNFKNRLYLNTGFWTSINQGNGYMMDFDWISGYIQSDGYGRTDWTHWSLSSVDIVESFLFDINLSFDFVESRELNLSVIGGYKSIYWDWSDKVLDSFYDGVPDVIPVGVDAIDYQLGLDIIYLGIGSGFYTHGFFIDGNFVYSPIVFGTDHDHHILTATHYYDKIILGQYIAFSIRSGYRFTNFFTLTGSFSVEYLFETRGTTYEYNESGVQTGEYTGGAGIQYEAVSISINAAFNF